MEKGEEDGGKTRIYVGGLGEGVTAEDLKKTFSSPQLGAVQSVDLIRTKGRSFAYLDFVPSSDNSLLKLFSKYNGCMWKGGRLRLEKAKQSFLLRLKREWEEDAKIASDSACPPSSPTTGSSDKPQKNPNLEKMQLHIYFPKLRKIRLIPLKGTGKHKYSFQRVEVPRFPTHFCSCEEHSGAAYTPKEKPLIDKEIEIGGVDQEELNIMASVMNKIFERENRPETAFRHVEGSDGVQSLTNVADHSMVDEAMDDDDDDDGIIINVVQRKNEGISTSYDIGKKPVTHNQKSPSEVKHGDQKTAARKRKFPQDTGGGAIDNLSATNDGKHNFRALAGDAVDACHIEAKSCSLQSNCKASSQQSAWGDPVDIKTDVTLNTADVGVDSTPGKKRQHLQSGTDLQFKSGGVDMSSFTDEKNQEKSEQHEGPAKIGEASSSKVNASTKKSAKGASWLQTSSWTQLVGGMNSSSFSISQIVPSFNFERQDLSISSGSGKQESGTDNSKGNMLKMGGGTNVNPPSAPGISIDGASEEKSNNVQLDQGVSKPDNHQQMDGVTNEEKKHQLTSKQTSLPDVSIGETCSFTKSATSMKQWMKAKTALSGSLKKKDK
nr:nucleolar protein 8 isoform X1 [Ipomoea batatas]